MVDDNNDFRENVEFFLTQKLGHTVIGSYINGLELKSSINAHSPDIVLLDINMPKMDGYETAKMLNWKNSGVKIIAITMFTDKAYMQKLVEVGFKGCVYKSDIFTDLPHAIEAVVNDDCFWPQNLK